MDLDGCLALLALLFALVVSIFFYAIRARLCRQLEAARTRENTAVEQMIWFAVMNSKHLEELSLVRKESQTTAAECNHLQVEVQMFKREQQKEYEELGDGHTRARVCTDLVEFLAHLPSLTPKQLEEKDNAVYVDAVSDFCPCIKPHCIAAATVLATKVAELEISKYNVKLVTTVVDKSLLELRTLHSTRLEDTSQMLKTLEETDSLIRGKMPLLQDAVLQLERHLRLPKRTSKDQPSTESLLILTAEIQNLDNINKTVSDPRSNQHLRIKAKLWEREALEITKLRNRNDELEASNTNTTQLKATVDRLQPQADHATTLTRSLTSAQNTISNMTIQIHNLKREASGSETAKLRSELATLNNKITEQQQTIMAHEAQSSSPFHSINHVAVDIKPFGLAGTESFELEAVRLLHWIRVTGPEVMMRAERMNIKTGLGWDAYAALEALVRQMVGDLEEGVRKVLALKAKGKV